MINSLFKSIRTQLLTLVMISVLPALGIILYSGLTIQQKDIARAESDVLRAVNSLDDDHGRIVDSTRQFLTTLSRLPDVQKQDAQACNRLFGELLKENPLYANIFSATAEGMVFSNARPFTPHSIIDRKYYQDVLKTMDFSVGEYVIGVTLKQPVLHFAYPVRDAGGKFKGMVVVAFDLNRYGRIFPMEGLPPGSRLNLTDHKNRVLYRHPDPENHIGRVDNPDMIRNLSSQLAEGTFTGPGNDGIKCLYGYKKFYLKGETSPYLFLRVGIPEVQALSYARNALVVNLALLGVALLFAMVLAWFLGRQLIVQRLRRLVDAAKRLGQGDLQVRTGLKQSQDELGLLTKAFDEMAGALEDKESQRESAQAALRESEERYKNFVEKSFAGVYVVQDGLFMFLNDNAASFSGYKPEELIGRQSDSIVHPADRGIIGEKAKKMFNGEDPSPYEFRIVTKDGQIRWIMETVTSIQYNGRKAILGNSMDITELKQAEEALHLFKDLVEHSSDAIGMSTPEGMHYYQNEAFDRLFGNIGDDPPDTVYVDKKIGEKVFDTIIGGGSWQGEVKMFKKDRTIVDIFQRAYAIKNQDDFVVGLVGLHTDITDRKQVEEALRQEQHFSKLVLDSLPGIFYLYTYPENRMILWNKQHETLLGYTTEETKNKFVTDWHLPEHKEAVLSAVEEVMKNGQSSIDGVLIAKDGHLIPFSFTGVRFEARGRLYFMGIGIDTTDRHTAEEENRSLQERLNRAEKMEALGLLAGGVAHDLNNVLGVVVGYAELVLMKADESSSIRPHLVNIMNGGLKAAAIVDDLLTLARRGVSDRDVLNLNKIIADCQKSPEFENLSSYHPSVKIKADLEPDLLNISGSSVHLGKSLFNLVSNASEAMPKGGVVIIKTTNQYLDKPIQGYDQIREGDYVVLSLSDTGEGISADNLRRIFEPFYTKKVMGRSGTGLGLSVVWGTVKDHHGYINVQSEEGKGSTFTLYFPITRDEIAAEAVAVPISEYMGQGESILVVDDVKEQRDLAASMLRALNYNVSSVESGEEAVAYLKEHQANLIVLDMIMDPGMDGLDTYKSILEICPKQKAVIVSGFSESDRVRAAKGLGAGAYVRKPYIKEKLGLAVKKEIDRAA